MTTEQLLPDADDAGQTRRWFLPLHDRAAQTDDVEYYRTYARFLGVGTSHAPTHSSAPHTDRNRFVPRGVRCNACRWFEARIFRELDLPDGVDDVAQLTDPAQARLGDYVIHFTGMSIVDGEVPFYRYETTASPHMVIEHMTTRRLTERGPEVFLAKPSAHALAVAAAYDGDLRDSYENRAVS
jgi:hypothetical protein